jgi:acid phosphatase family membrane protein YuiD
MYIYLFTPIVAFCIAQGLKIFLRSRKQKITWHDIFSYSDMPSGHTSTVISLVSILALKQGLDSPIFACAFVYALIVITDAMGLRNYLGSHGKTLTF